MSTVWQPVIGLEVHAQLQTQTKLFCGCSTAFGASANTQVCPICLGMPGALPTVNGQAIALAIKAALALQCTLQPWSRWARKNYFYPDLPKGYQITQADQPYALAGKLDIAADGFSETINITRIHVEEDAGKNIHDSLSAKDRSYVDFNRGGTPLIEIVSEPDIRSPEQAGAYLKTLRSILRALDVCDGNMEQGSFRCDANISLRPQGSTTYGTRVEIKNINSFRFVQQALHYEIMRQAEVLEQGGQVVQETRLYDAQAKATRAMRSKEDARDYRYFPEPDLPMLYLRPELLASVAKDMPLLPAQQAQALVEQHGLSPYDAGVLTSDVGVMQFYLAALAWGGSAKGLANWMMNEVLRICKEKPIEELLLTPQALSELVQLIEQETISGKIAKDIFAEIIVAGGMPRAWMERKGIQQLSQTSDLLPMIQAVLTAHPEVVERYRAGKTNVLGFLVGQIMQKTQGQANPKKVHDLMVDQLK